MKRMSFVAILVLSGLMVMGSVAWAASDTATEKVMSAEKKSSAPTAISAGPLLKLDEAFEMALKNNLSLQTARFGPKIASEQVREAESIFNPSVDASYNHMQVREDMSPSMALSAGGAGVYWQHLDTYSGGAQKLFTTGTVARVQVNGNRTRDLITSMGIMDPAHASDVTLNLSQPILQGFGKDVVTGGVTIAEHGLQSQKEVLAQAAEGIVYQTEAAYWNVVFARENYQIALETEGLTARLLEEVAAKIEIGVMAPVDRVQVEAQAAQRHQTVIEAKLAKENAEDSLRRILGISKEDWAKSSFSMEEVNIIKSNASDFDKQLDEAYLNRKDLRSLSEQLKAADVQRILAEDQQQPELNVVGGLGLNGLDDDLGGSYDNMDGDHYQWNVGLTFGVPLGYSGADARAEQSRLQAHQLEASEKDLRQGIFNDVRVGMRSISSARENCEVAQTGLKLYKTQLDVAQERFRLGLTTLTDLLKFQEDYSNARVRDIQARIGVVEAASGLELVKGTLLKYHGLEGVYE